MSPSQAMKEKRHFFMFLGRPQFAKYICETHTSNRLSFDNSLLKGGPYFASQLPIQMIFFLYTWTSALIIQLAVATLYSRLQIVSDLAVDIIGRFCPIFLQNVSFIYVTKLQNLFGVVWRVFTPLKQPGKLTLGIFQNLLSNSVNSESLFYCLLDLA